MRQEGVPSAETIPYLRLKEVEAMMVLMRAAVGGRHSKPDTPHAAAINVGL